MLRVFVLEDSSERRIALSNVIRFPADGAFATWAISRASAERLWSPPYDIFLLDNDLGGEGEETQGGLERRNTGLHFVRTFIHDHQIEDTTVICHSLNYPARMEICRRLPNAHSIPFSPQLLHYLRDEID